MMTNTTSETVSGTSNAECQRIDLQSILGPVSVDEFLSVHYGRNFLRMPGENGRFQDLLRWSALNWLLEWNTFGQGQLRLVKEGKDLPAQYLVNANWRVQSGRLELEEALRGGATLAINKIDRLWKPIAGLASRMERILQADIGVNMYAGFKASNGFLKHWDDHDVFILQVSGSKRWEVFPQSFKFPKYKGKQILPPECDPVWQGDLNSGDALYIPRGWWHIATPCNEPTLHLTVGTKIPTGRDMLQWVLTELEDQPDMECLRADIPRFQDVESKTRYVSELRKTVSDALDTPGLLGAFLRSSDIQSKPRQHYGLPWSAMQQGFCQEEGSVFTVVPRYVELGDVTEHGVVEVSFNGRTVSVAGNYNPLLRWIIKKTEVPIQELRDEFEGSFDSAAVSEFVSEMVRCGLLSVATSAE